VEKYRKVGHAAGDNMCALLAGYLATDTRSEYAILIAFPQQQWLHERSSVPRLHAHCLSCLRKQRNKPGKQQNSSNLNAKQDLSFSRWC